MTTHTVRRWLDNSVATFHHHGITYQFEAPDDNTISVAFVDDAGYFAELHPTTRPKNENAMAIIVAALRSGEISHLDLEDGWREFWRNEAREPRGN